MSLVRLLSSIFKGSVADQHRSFSEIGTLLISDVVAADVLEGTRADEFARASNIVFALTAECVHEKRGIIVSADGDGMLAVWKSSLHSSHANQALSCGQMILTRLGRLSTKDSLLRLRIALGTGKMTGGSVGGRFQLLGAPFTTAKRLLELELPRRSQILYTSETMAHESANAVARMRGVKGDEILVFEHAMNEAL